jgi:hypothetical protein
MYIYYSLIYSFLKYINWFNIPRTLLVSVDTAIENNGAFSTIYDPEIKLCEKVIVLLIKWRYIVFFVIISKSKYVYLLCLRETHETYSQMKLLNLISI